MTPFELITLALASWYVAYVVTQTHGPFSIFQRVRNWLPLGGLTSCIICLMVWVSAALYVLHIDALTTILAVAGLALWGHSFTGWRVNM